MISMRVDGPDRCNSPPTGAPKIGFGPQSYVEYICSTPTRSPLQFYPTIPTSDDEKKNKKKNKKKKKNENQNKNDNKIAKVLVNVLYIKDTPFRQALICECDKSFGSTFDDPACTCKKNGQPQRKKSFLGIPTLNQHLEANSSKK
jgi:hypothetical protein